MKKKPKNDGEEPWYRLAREISKEVRTQGKATKEIAQGALTIASTYWVLRLGGNKKGESTPFLEKIDRIFKRAGLSITELR